jgi:integrase
LKQWRWKSNDPKSGFMFATGNDTPLDQTNVVDRQILPALNVCVHCGKGREDHSKAKHNYERDAARPQWRGWHAFRRGLATTLHALGENDQTIQNILRHANVKTTQNCYIKAVPANSKKAMQRFGQMYETKALKA